MQKQDEIEKSIKNLEKHSGIPCEVGQERALRIKYDCLCVLIFNPGILANLTFLTELKFVLKRTDS